MKLELKHLDFINNGRVRLTRLPWWDFENVELQNCELFFNTSSKEPYLRYKDIGFRLDETKVYKRPLSDLTKEIEHNGEKFVPIDCFLGEDSDNILNAFQSNQNADVIEYSLVQKLLEWHFDIYGLIEKGLAIEKK